MSSALLVQVDIKGFDELRRVFKGLPAKMKREVLEATFRRGAAKIAASSRGEAPVGKSHRLRGAVRTKWGKQGKWAVSRDAYVNSGKDRKDTRGAYYAHMVEFGHAIRKKKGGPAVGHVPANPFMRRAFLQHHHRIVADLYHKADQVLSREMSKVK